MLAESAGSVVHKWEAAHEQGNPAGSREPTGVGPAGAQDKAPHLDIVDGAGRQAGGTMVGGAGVGGIEDGMLVVGVEAATEW